MARLKIFLGNPTASSGAQSISVSQITETNLAQAIAVVLGALMLSVGQVSETDAAQTITPVMAGTVAVSQVTETDTAQAITPSLGALVVAAAQATETDLAQAITANQGAIIAADQASETDLAQTVTPVLGALSIAVGQVTETDLAQSITLASVTLGGEYNAAARFSSGGSVSIVLYDPVTGDIISLDSSVCTEIGTTGMFVWDASKLTTQPTGYKEYIWRMHNGTLYEGGVLNVAPLGGSVFLRRR